MQLWRVLPKGGDRSRNLKRSAGDSTLATQLLLQDKRTFDQRFGGAQPYITATTGAAASAGSPIDGDVLAVVAQLFVST
jgi:hypothetical protein